MIPAFWCSTCWKEDKMKTVVLIVGVSVVLVAGCVGVRKDPVVSYIPPTPTASFAIGAFEPNATEYNYKHYDEGKAVAFLASVNDRFSEGDIVALDGLKWKKIEGEWQPIPNPPIPVLKPGEASGDFINRYAEWIDNHPHFDYPPIPLANKE